MNNANPPGVSRDEIVRRGRRLIGSALRKIRKDANLKSDFAADFAKMGASMVRMIEAGRSEVPLGKIRSYATALGVGRNGPKLAADALADAYSSLRTYALEPTTSGHDLDRFNWAKLFASADEAAVDAYIYAELTRPQAYANSIAQPAAQDSLSTLNPIQRALIENIAARFRTFGTDVLSDEATAEWERLSAQRLRGVYAIACSLESELGAGFVESLRNAIKQPQFEGYRYLVVHDGSAHELDEARRDIIKSVGGPLSNSQDFADFITVLPISREEYSDFLTRLIPPEAAGWDGLYLYKLDDTSPDLLIGAFRRIPSPFGRPEPMHIRKWGAIAMNEALPWRLIPQYQTAFEDLWSKALERTIPSATFATSPLPK